MADTFWLGGTGVFGLDANWSGVHPDPVAPDNAIWDGRTTISCTDDAHAQTAELFGDFTIEPQYTGMIGTAGSSLRLSVANLHMRGPGVLHFENGDTSDTARVIINNPSCTAYLGCETAKIDTIEALQGDVTLTATLTGLLTLTVFDSNVTILGSNQIDLIRIYGRGNVTCMPEVTLLEHFGTGTFTQLPLSGNVVTTMKIGSGAKVIYQSADTPIVLAEIHDGGSLDVTGARAVLTITTLRMGPRAIFRKSNTTVVGTELTL